MRTGIRYDPRASVVASKVLPVASCRARTVTPGSTPPVESVTVPVSEASCADAAAGSARMAQTKMTELTMRDVIRTSRIHGVERHGLCRNANVGPGLTYGRQPGADR